MQFLSMDETLIKINKLKNIDSIDLKFIKNKIPFLIVFYDNGKYLSLASDDNYFKEFIRRVKYVYLKEKSEGRDIIIDNDTADILENGNLDNINDIYSYYSNKCLYDESLLFESDKVKSLIEIVKYHLRELFSKTNINVCFDGCINGYRTFYTINGKVNGYNSIIKLSYREVGINNYEFIISGIIPGLNEILMNITFDKESIKVYTNIPSYEITSKYEYFASNQGVKCNKRIFKDNTLLYINDKELEETNKPSYSLIDFDSTGNLKWFKLPWGAYYATDIKYSSLGTNNEIGADLKRSHEEELRSVRIMYVDCNDDYFVKKDIYSKIYVVYVNGEVNSQKVTLDKMSKNLLCLRISDNSDAYVIETEFTDLKGFDGYYDEHLEGNYYYHLVSAPSIIDIQSEDIKPIDKDSVLYKSDLLDKKIVLKVGEK